ncbi:hypothetical protein ACFZDF_19615 [Streptomyces sp. NPDC007910]|uniref:hypothetical protein n=1 Tax=Streptomyces sp. NPDC007910 TaxID=3364790 RepID=UPI0036EBD436
MSTTAGVMDGLPNRPVRQADVVDQSTARELMVGCSFSVLRPGNRVFSGGRVG